jgi:hypothetical protein
LGIEALEDRKEQEMSNYLRHTRQPWTSADDAALRRLAAGNTPTRVIGLKLGRSEDAIRSRAVILGISLKPTNQSPYGSR